MIRTTFEGINPQYLQLYFRLFKDFLLKYDSIVNTLQEENVELSSINNVIKYESYFEEFVKAIKECCDNSISHYSLLKERTICDDKFFSKGLTISKNAIQVYNLYSKMQDLFTNIFKVLKLFTYFVNVVLHDEEYALMLLINLKENLETLSSKLMIKNNESYLNRNVGIMYISGVRKNYCKILALNKRTNKIFSKKDHFTLLFQNIKPR